MSFSSRAAPLLEALPTLRVLVLGDSMLDVYLRGHSNRLCPEGPVPIVECDERVESPGGAANTALNLRALGAEVTLLSVIGSDSRGRRLCEQLSRQGVVVEHLLVHPRRQTLCKQRIMADAQLVARVDQGDASQLGLADQRVVAERLERLFREFDAVVLSDYGYGSIGAEVIASLAELARHSPTVLVGDSKSLWRYGAVRFTAVKPNYGQAATLLAAPAVAGAERVEQMLRLGPGLLDALQTRIAAVTLDQEGAIVFERGRLPLRTFTKPNPHTQAAGAGDTYVAALALALAAGGETAVAAELAATAAAVVVAKEGTSCCTLAELKLRLAGRETSDVTLDALGPQLEEHRLGGRRLVLTNGCFDILHRGHVTYLNQARALGDVLIVGVNSDDSIRRLKGPERPINSLEDRMQVLAALDCVDHVVAFDEETPHRLVRAIRPHVFVKGGDYTREQLPEAALVEELGGRIEILPLFGERSTTKLIKRIRAADDLASQSAALVNALLPLPASAPT